MEKKLVLIVDDKNDNRLLLRKIIASKDYIVQEAANGQEGLKIARLHKPDVIISDILMPVMDGFLFCKEVKKDETLKNIPFVFYTATYSDKEDEEFGLSLGAEKYLVKPLEPDVLLNILEHIIEKYKNGHFATPKKVIGAEKEIFKHYSERLINKLEKKMLDLEKEIIKRKQTEKALKESESLKNTIIESSPDCIKLLDLEGNLTYMSKGGQEKLEIKDINIYLNKCWIDFWQGKDNINARMAVDTTVKGGIGKFQGYSPTEAGKPRWWDVIITPILGSNGEVAQLLAVSRDITEQKQMEENLRQLQKMESISTLTGGIAHDFNNIMGIILGNAELALDDVPEWNPAHSNLEEIKKASLRAANIVRQLLSFTRITDQKLQPMEIALVIKDALKFLRSTIPTTIDIEQDIFVTDETILADPTQINQIMMNLCINASHAMESTGGKLTIIVEKVVLDDNSAKDYPDLKIGKYVKLMVSDTGPGIDPKIIDRIFDPYFTTKGIGKGSGMGLAVVHGIVKSHRGTIAVDSTLGKGTKFSILFPLSQGKAAVEAKTIQEIPRGNETILFVDDEISIANMVQRMFERLGYKVQTATTPQDALDRFALNPDHFDLVITDMTMPQMTGVKLSEKLMDIRPDIPIIICTGYSALVDEEKAKELGLAAYVMKPINLSEIAQTIRKVLEK